MSSALPPIPPNRNRAITSICVMAAFADGAHDERERGRIQQIVNRFSEDHIDLASAYQDVLEGKPGGIVGWAGGASGGAGHSASPRRMLWARWLNDTTQADEPSTPRN